MKIKANDYKANEVMKIIREWTTLSQEKFAKEVGRSRNSINNIENNRNRIFLNDFLDICDKFDVVVTLEKKKYKTNQNTSTIFIGGYNGR